MFVMTFGHGLKISPSGSWSVRDGRRDVVVWVGRVVECEDRWCFECTKFLRVGELVEVCEEHFHNRRFFHDQCLPRRLSRSAVQAA
jgi:hypothetical protein